MFPDNDWYGHKKILIDYLNLKDHKIFGSLQHGWQSQFSLIPIKKIMIFILFYVGQKN